MFAQDFCKSVEPTKMDEGPISVDSHDFEGSNILHIERRKIVTFDEPFRFPWLSCT